MEAFRQIFKKKKCFVISRYAICKLSSPSSTHQGHCFTSLLLKSFEHPAIGSAQSPFIDSFLKLRSYLKNHHQWEKISKWSNISRAKTSSGWIFKNKYLLGDYLKTYIHNWDHVRDMNIYINPEFLEERPWCGGWEEGIVCDCSCMSIRLLLLLDIPIPCMACIPTVPASEAVRERLPRWEDEDIPPTAETEAESTTPSGRTDVLNLLTMSSSWCLPPAAEEEEEDCREVKNFSRSRIFGFSLNCGMSIENPGVNYLENDASASRRRKSPINVYLRW